MLANEGAVVIDPTHLAELERERQHLVEVEIFLIERLGDVQNRMSSIDTEIGSEQ